MDTRECAGCRRAAFVFERRGRAGAVAVPFGHTQAMMSHHRMMNQMDMMHRSQTLQSMARAREAQEARRAKQARAKCQGSAQGATGKTCKAASGKSKAPVKKK